MCRCAAHPRAQDAGAAQEGALGYIRATRASFTAQMVAFVKCTQGKHRGYVGKVVAQKRGGHLTLKWGLPWTTPAVVPGTDCVPLGYAISVQQLHNHNMATYALQEED